jgi:hypothetical protein
MKCADAKNLDRKSGKHGAPVQGVGLVVALGVFPQPVEPLRADFLAIFEFSRTLFRPYI